MKRAITQTTIEAAKPQAKAYEIRDTKVSGFLIRVQPSGKERASISYAEFLESYYYPWVDANLRSAYEYRRVLNVNCKAFTNTQLKEFDIRMVEKWRLKLLASGKTPNTVNRIYTNFRASLSKAEEWGLIEEHPLRKMKPIKTAQKSIVRYLSTDEEKRLRIALDKREERKRSERNSANNWRKQRGYSVLPDSDEFMDHLKPMILLSMNTGMRRGEVFKLTWQNVNFDTRQLTVTGQTTKSGKTRYIPLNKEALDILEKWRLQRNSNSKLVFSNKDGTQFTTLKKGWAGILKAADVQDFRWHDLRHHFASRLVMAGVNLNTVRELLGHSSYAMTLRYAHLSDGHKAEAVELLI